MTEQGDLHNSKISHLTSITAGGPCHANIILFLLNGFCVASKILCRFQKTSLFGLK